MWSICTAWHAESDLGQISRSGASTCSDGAWPREAEDHTQMSEVSVRRRAFRSKSHGRRPWGHGKRLLRLDEQPREYLMRDPRQGGYAVPSASVVYDTQLLDRASDTQVYGPQEVAGLDGRGPDPTAHTPYLYPPIALRGRGWGVVVVGMALLCVGVFVCMPASVPVVLGPLPERPSGGALSP